MSSHPTICVVYGRKTKHKGREVSASTIRNGEERISETSYFKNYAVGVDVLDAIDCHDAFDEIAT